MDLAIRTPCPSNDLVLIPLEHDYGWVPERGAANGGVGVISHVIEVTKHDVVRDDIDQRIWVLSDAARDVVD